MSVSEHRDASTSDLVKQLSDQTSRLVRHGDLAGGAARPPRPPERTAVNAVFTPAQQPQRSGRAGERRTRVHRVPRSGVPGVLASVAARPGEPNALQAGATSSDCSLEPCRQTRNVAPLTYRTPLGASRSRGCPPTAMTRSAGGAGRQIAESACRVPDTVRLRGFGGRVEPGRTRARLNWNHIDLGGRPPPRGDAHRRVRGSRSGRRAGVVRRDRGRAQHAWSRPCDRRPERRGLL